MNHYSGLSKRVKKVNAKKISTNKSSVFPELSLSKDTCNGANIAPKRLS